MPIRICKGILFSTPPFSFIIFVVLIITNKTCLRWFLILWLMGIVWYRKVILRNPFFRSFVHSFSHSFKFLKKKCCVPVSGARKGTGKASTRLISWFLLKAFLVAATDKSERNFNSETCFKWEAQMKYVVDHQTSLQHLWKTSQNQITGFRRIGKT